MKSIVERCPQCGVEHDERVHECEACGSAVRYWCRAHSGQIGWLDGPACSHCASRPRRAPHPAPRPTPRRAPRAAPRAAPRPARTATRPHRAAPVVYDNRLWGPAVQGTAFRSAGLSAAVMGAAAGIVGAGWPGIIVFGCLALVFGGMLGWLVALDGGPDAA